MTTVMEGIQIVVTQKGAKIVRKELDQIGTSGSKAATGVKGLGTALGFLSAGLVAREIVQLVDTFTNMQNRLKLVTTGTENLNAVTSELGAIARRTRTSFEGTATIFSRVALATKELGVTQEELLNFTQSLNQATILSGASAKEAFNGIIQLSQGMGAGALRGDELRSVLEQLPAVADTIARGMGVARASLRELGAQGAITSDVILRAFASDRLRLMEQFAETVPTMGQAFEVVRTDIIFFLATLDQALGASSAVAEVMIFLGGRINELGFIVLGVAGFFAVQWVAGLSAATAATTAFATALTFLQKNAFTLIVTAIITVIGYLITFRQTLSESGGILGAIGSVVNAVVVSLTVLARVLGLISAGVDQAFGNWSPLLKTALVSLTAVVVALNFFSVNLNQVRLGVQALWALILANPWVLFIATLTAVVALVYKFRDSLGVLGDFITSIGKIFGKVFDFIKNGLKELGIISLGANGEINLNINGDDAGTTMKDSIKEAGDTSAAAMKKGIIDGGTKAATSMKKATSNAGKDAAKSLRDGAPSAGKDYGKAAAAPISQASEKGGAVFSAAGVSMSQAAFDIAGATGRYQEAVNKMFAAIRAQIQLVQYQGELVDAQRIQIQEARLESAADRRSAENIARINASASKSVANTAASATKQAAVTAAAASASSSSAAASTSTASQETSASERFRKALASGLPAFAQGGSFDVGGNSGVDNNTLSVNNRPVARVSKGETVIITPEERKRRRERVAQIERPTVINFNVNAQDAASFQRSEQQIQARLSSQLTRANERNN